jgi:rare lipoprotein A
MDGAHYTRLKCTVRKKSAGFVGKIFGWMLIAALVIEAGCAARSRSPAAMPGRPLEVREGLATYYGKEFNGKTTASGARYDMNALVAAHPSYPFGTLVRVTNLVNGRTVQLRIIDRGPAAGARAAGVVIDVSHRAAQELRFEADGRTRVRIEVVRWGT